MNSMTETKFSITNLKNLYIVEFFIQPFIPQAVLIVKWLCDPLSKNFRHYVSTLLKKLAFISQTFIEH